MENKKEVDHIFIFSTNSGIEADELLEWGFVEGSSRVHKGQGTVNRKFYFNSFFLEILWVINEKEILQSPAKETDLWQRSRFSENNHSRFGICLVNTEETDSLFESSKKYQPDYFPEGMSIDFLSNSQNPSLPWTFRLPYRNQNKTTNGPGHHGNGISTLTKIKFGVNKIDSSSNYLKHFEGTSIISFIESKDSNLHLEFDSGKQGKLIECKSLSLVITY